MEVGTGYLKVGNIDILRRKTGIGDEFGSLRLHRFQMEAIIIAAAVPDDYATGATHFQIRQRCELVLIVEI